LDTKFFSNDYTKNDDFATEAADIIVSTRAVYQDYIIPTGKANNKGKALILAPFRFEFEANYSEITNYKASYSIITNYKASHSIIKNLLESAGYLVTPKINLTSDAKTVVLDDFKGSHLTQYDIIFLETHGRAELRTMNNHSATVFLTNVSIPYTELNKFLNNTPHKDQLALVAKYDYDAKVCYPQIAVSPQWIKATSGGTKFPDSWFFVNACETYKTTSGSGSMAATLIGMGVVGYNGYKEEINALLATAIGVKMTSYFTSGLDFIESSKRVLSDEEIIKFESVLEDIVVSFDIPDGLPMINRSLFTYSKPPKKFYIVPPKEQLDGKTIKLTAIPKSHNRLGVQVSGSGTATVDWGDNTQPVTRQIGPYDPWSSTSNFSHTYSSSSTEPRTITIIGENVTVISVNVPLPLYGGITDETRGPFRSINANGHKTLKEIYCLHNKITDINVSNCTALRVLDCPVNYLSRLNVEGCIKLEELLCNSNQLTTLNMNGCSSLTRLRCNGNQLASINNLNGCVALQRLYCDDNRLSSLNVAGLSKLIELNSDNNQLTSLNVTGCTALRTLRCQNNSIRSEIPAWFSQFTTFFKDRRYYYPGEYVSQNGQSVRLTTLLDRGVGWWYPGEPGKGAHRP